MFYIAFQPGIAGPRCLATLRHAAAHYGNQGPSRYHCAMFSYRHAFHAGNHADVLKHTVLIATLQHLTDKDAALTVLDTHAGAGLYRLDGDYASTSGEAGDGILRLTAAGVAALTPALQAYVDMVKAFNQGATTKVYPGSPFIIQRLLRDHDKLKLFELHPTDLRALAGNVAQLEAGRQVAVLHEDGFEGIKKFLPPPARRALVLCDPSYEMKSDYASTSGEAGGGILRLTAAGVAALTPALQAYVDMVKAFNQGATTKVYPGSPFIIQRLLRDHDKLKLFELHPTDLRALAGNVAQLEAGRQVAVLHEDGFEGIKKFLPPPARRALVLCDPSYEMKSDYAKVLDMAADSLKRFATGTYAVWYPIIPRPEAHDLPRRLKTMATKAGKSWLHATLTVKSSKLTENAEGEVKRPGLPASGMFLINPPFTLKAALKTALPQMVELLAQDKHATHTLESGG